MYTSAVGAYMVNSSRLCQRHPRDDMLSPIALGTLSGSRDGFECSLAIALHLVLGIHFIKVEIMNFEEE